MIIKYGFSLTGKSHITRDAGCQDAHKIVQLENGWIIAAVADGVGSASNSHIGAKIASDTVVGFCRECMPHDYNTISIKSMIRTAFNYALKKIYQEAEANGKPVESYDTTLTMVIYDGRRIIYGHSGDGAVLGLTVYGNYVEITTPQKGSDMISVVPLRAGYTHWVVDTYNEDLAAVLLVTDGMLDTFSPYLLKFGDDKIYVPLVMFFADPYCFDGKVDDQELKAFLTADDNYSSDRFYDRMGKGLEKRFEDKQAAETVRSHIKENNYPVTLMNKQQDDKTVVGLINLGLETVNQQDGYYGEPDWASLQEQWNRKAYPHLYADEYREEIADVGLINEVIEELQPEGDDDVPAGDEPDASKTGSLLHKVKNLL